MSYGKLVIKMEVVDPMIGEEDDNDNVCAKHSRQVTLLSKYGVSYAVAHKTAMFFIDSNVPRECHGALDVMWYPDPVRIGSWHHS